MFPDEPDEFDSYDFSEFTVDDLALLDAQLARGHGGPAVQIDSPYRHFRSQRKSLSVTDLVSPLWCELQHEYGLYGKRYKPLPQRPVSFVSRTGKQIRVHHQVAHANDRRLRRGKSVHKALEEELTPDKVVVRPTSEEERFGLRLIQLIGGFNQLVSKGLTRELPVFVITHGQIVLGVIDEVLLTKASQGQANQNRVGSLGSTPTCSPPKKRQRLVSSPTLQHLPDVSAQASATSSTDPSQLVPPCAHADLYELRIIDYKTRRAPNVPPDADSLSPRIQLMMYHRMLSTLLEPDTFDFNLLWSRLGLSPTKPFSAKFLQDIGQRQVDTMDSNVNLESLVSEWISIVQEKRPGFLGVSQQLQIIYRRAVLVGQQQEKGKQNPTNTVYVDDPLEALVLQEEADLAHAIQESLVEIGYQEAGRVAQHVSQNVKQAGPSFVGCTSTLWETLISPPESGPTDPALAWAIQESLLTCAHRASAQRPANILQQTGDDTLSDKATPVVATSTTGAQEGSTAELSPIIGTKEFEMNNDELDAHLDDVLQWWFGVRPARGVGITQTNRCFTCEFHASCEWREQKAREAAELGQVKQERNNV